MHVNHSTFLHLTKYPQSLPSDTEVVRLLAIPTLLPSPLSSLSSPLTLILSPLPQILSPPLHVSSSPLPASLTYPLGYRAAMIQLRAETPSTSYPLPSSTPPSGTPPLLPIPLPIPSPPLLLPSTDYRAGVSEITLPPRKRLCIALGPRYEVGESSSTPTARPTGGFRVDYGFVGTFDDEIRRDPERYVGYGIIDTWDKMVEDMHGTPAVTDVAELSQRMTDFVTTVRQDTDEIYVRLDDTQDDRSLMSGRLNMLYRDRRAHARTARLMETEARLSREAWVQSMDASDTTHFEVRALRTTVLAQQAEIGALRAADRTRQAQLVETLTLMSTLQTQEGLVNEVEGLYDDSCLRYEVGESSSAPTARPTRGFRANYGFVAILEDKIRRDPERDVGYGITDTWDEMLVCMPGAPTTDDIELGRRMTEFAIMVREAIISREAWGRSMDAIDTAPSEVRALRTIVLAQQTEIAALRVADRARQAQHMETLRLISILQIQVTTL
ncbi:hypothetical protein Tco_0084376 [Tanacetum coccineum]